MPRVKQHQPKKMKCKYHSVCCFLLTRGLHLGVHLGGDDSFFGHLWGLSISWDFCLKVVNIEATLLPGEVFNFATHGLIEIWIGAIRDD